MTVLTACSGSPIERVHGHWKLDLDNGSRLDVTIYSEIKAAQVEMSGPGRYGRNELFMRESGTIEENGDNLIINFRNGGQAHLKVNGKKLLSDDGKPFTKL